MSQGELTEINMGRPVQLSFPDPEDELVSQVTDKLTGKSEPDEGSVKYFMMDGKIKIYIDGDWRVYEQHYQ